MSPCQTCKYAKFEWTRHNPPRINKTYVGFCEYHTDPATLPIPAALDKKDVLSTLNPKTITLIPDNLPTTCPVWEE